MKKIINHLFFVTSFFVVIKNVYCVEKVPTFDQYKVAEHCDQNIPKVTFPASLADIEKQLRPIINEAFKNNRVFAGCYKFILTPNLTPFLIDIRNGNLIKTDIRDEFEPSGLDYREDSNLVIANRHKILNVERNKNTNAIPVYYFVFDQGVFKKIYSEPCQSYNLKPYCGKEMESIPETGRYQNKKFKFSFSYNPREFGDLEEQKTNDGLYLQLTSETLHFSKTNVEGDQYDTYLRVSTSKDIDRINKAVATDETGDSSYFLTLNGWKNEMELLSKSKTDSIVPCIQKKGGVSNTFVCEVRTIGKNRYLIDYVANSYKELTTQILYITYHNNLRYEFGGESFYTEKTVIPDYFGNDQTPIEKTVFYDLIKNHKLPLEKIGKSMEKLVASFQFDG